MVNRGLNGWVPLNIQISKIIQNFRLPDTAVSGHCFSTFLFDFCALLTRPVLADTGDCVRLPFWPFFGFLSGLTAGIFGHVDHSFA